MQGRKQFVIACKHCRRDVPAGVKEFPFHSVVVVCPLCEDEHRYLPSEMSLGHPDPLVGKESGEPR
jgi:hypothetical protein